MSWTRAADLLAQLEKLWDQGRILASLATGAALFPRRLSLSGPSSAEMSERFEAVRAWIRELQAMPRIRIESRTFRHRVLGDNAVPAEAWVDSIDDAVALLRKGKEVARFAALLQETGRRQPAWLDWLAQKPLQALALADDWSRFLAIADWCGAHPRSGLYLRQIDIPGIHSKYIEARRGPLSELLDLALPPQAIDLSATGASRFAARYGFRDKPVRIRLRALDPAAMPAWPGQDITLTAEDFTRLDPPVGKLFITENEINFLALPPVADSLVIFGAGYGFETLRAARWLSRCRLYYWGDIDTHGFAILDQLRQHVAHAQSLLMDRATLMQFRSLWGHEDKPTRHDLPRLTEAERALYDDLRDNRIGKTLRLEQERIGFHWLEAALARI